MLNKEFKKETLGKDYGKLLRDIRFVLPSITLFELCPPILFWYALQTDFSLQNVWMQGIFVVLIYCGIFRLVLYVHAMILFSPQKLQTS